MPVQIQLIRDMRMADAIKYARERCITPFLLKVDDDFIMHPRFIEFALQQLSEDYTASAGLFWWHLWENWSQEVVQSVKIYPIGAMWEVPFEPGIL